MFQQVIIERLEPPAGAADPLAQGRAVEFDALACIDLGLPVEGQGVEVFADDDEGDQRLGRHAAVDRPSRCRSLDDSAFDVRQPYWAGGRR